MQKKDNMNNFHNEINVAVSLTGLLTAVTIFFTGLLITRFDSYDISIKVPILFLIISTFGFLYSTLIYSNASGFLTRLNCPEKYEKCMIFGNVISEYLGVYLLILSIPLIINIITTDMFLRYSTLIVTLGGMLIYHLQGFSIMERHFKQKHINLALIILIFSIVLFGAQIYLTRLFVPIAILFLIFLSLITFYASKKGEQKFT